MFSQEIFLEDKVLVNFKLFSSEEKLTFKASSTDVIGCPSCLPKLVCLEYKI